MPEPSIERKSSVKAAAAWQAGKKVRAGGTPRRQWRQGNEREVAEPLAAGCRPALGDGAVVLGLGRRAPAHRGLGPRQRRPRALRLAPRRQAADRPAAAAGEPRVSGAGRWPSRCWRWAPRSASRACFACAACPRREGWPRATAERLLPGESGSVGAAEPGSRRDPDSGTAPWLPCWEAQAAPRHRPPPDPPRDARTETMRDAAASAPCEAARPEPSRGPMPWRWPA
jgi:hypothetical protein